MAKLKGGTRIYGNATIDTTLTATDVTILGNLNIKGTTTTVDTSVSTIKDPVITLGADANGASTNDALDRGLVLRYNDGADKSGFMGWDQGNSQFAVADTTTFTASNNSVIISTYGNLKAGHFIGEGDTLANITGANVTGTVALANSASYATNVTGNAQANITSVGTLTGLTIGNVTANTTFGNGTITAGGIVSITANTEATNTSTGALKVTGGVAVGANLHVGGNIYGNFAGNIAAKGNNTEVQFNDNGAQNAVAQFTFDKSSNALTVTGTITGGNLSTAGTLNVTGNANVGNLGTSGLITATGTVTGGNLSTGGTLGVTGNANVGNLGTSGLITATGNVSGGNLTTTGDVTTVTITASGNISTTANLSVTGNANVTGTANVGNLTTGGNIDGTGASSTANVQYLTVRSTANITSTLTAGNLSTAGTADVTGNATVGNLITTGRATVGNLTMSSGALVTGDLIPATNEGGNLGNSTNAWKDLWLSGNSIKLGTQTISSNAGGVNISNTITAANITATDTMTTVTLNASGAITGANVTANNISDTQVVYGDGSKLKGSSAFTFASASGTLSATLFTGTLTTNSQPNITSVGTLTDLTVTNVANANISGYSSTVSGNAQANITSVGTLTGLVVSGNIQSNANVITDNILAKGTNITITAGTGNANIVLAPTGNGTVDVSNKRITGLATPTDSTDAATKGYVDASSQGLDIKNSVRVSTTTNIDLTAGGLLTIDGVTTVAGDRVLVKAQTNKIQNGIYIVAVGAWARSGDAYLDGQLTPGSFTFIEEGTTYHDSGWVISTNGTITIGTSVIEWTQFSGAGQLTANSGVQLIGSNFSANVDNSTIDIQSGAIHVKDGLTLVTPNIGAATGTSLDIGTGNLTAGNATIGGGSGGSITGANLVSANYFTGTLTTNAQPNITSVGTLGNANVATTLNVGSNAFIANANGIYTNGYYYANGDQIDFQTAAGNATEIQFKSSLGNDLASSNNFTFNASSNTLTVTGTANVSGQVVAGNIKTDSLTTGRVTFQGVGNVLADSANLTFSSNTLTVTGTANVSGQVIVGNLRTDSLTTGRVTFQGVGNVLADDSDLTFDAITNELKSGNANVVGYMTAGNVTARNLTAGSITFATAGGLLTDNANLTFNTAGNILTVDNASLSGNVTAAQFIGNGVQLSNVAGANVSGQVGNALVAGTVYGNAQANITSVGTLTGLTVAGLTDLGPIGNLKLTGGSNGYALTTDGSGNLQWTSVGTSKIANGTSEVSIPGVNGDITVTRGGNLIITVTGTGANITGALDVTGNISGNNISAANTITANANTDSTSSITGTVKVTGGMAATGNIYTGHSVGFANNNGGTDSKAYIQFNATANSLDFIFN
jgi:hypothetical protein